MKKKILVAVYNRNGGADMKCCRKRKLLAWYLCITKMLRANSVIEPLLWK